MKRLAAIILSVILLLTCASCTQEARPDITMLSERMAAIDERYAFDYFDMFIYENIYHVYLSICTQDDILLSFGIGDNGNIDNLTITAYSDTMKNSEELQKFMNAVIDSFAVLTDKEKSEKENSLSYNKPETYFSNLYETYSSLRYNFIFSSNSMYICLYCEYYESMTI